MSSVGYIPGQQDSMPESPAGEAPGPSAPRMQQLLHGLRLAAADDLTRADDLERLARFIENTQRRSDRDDRRRSA